MMPLLHTDCSCSIPVLSDILLYVNFVIVAVMSAVVINGDYHYYNYSISTGIE